MSRPELKKKKIIVVSDCKQAVAWVNSIGVRDWKFLQLILGIISMLDSLGQVSIEFNSRDTNSYADALAKRGAGGGGVGGMEGFMAWVFFCVLLFCLGYPMKV